MPASDPPVVGTNAPYVQVEVVNLLDWGGIGSPRCLFAKEEGWSKCLLLLLPLAPECQ